MRRTTVLAVCLAVFAVAWLGWSPDKIAAQSGGASGAITGNVTADRGEVRGFRVKARDTGHRIAYTVFAQKGRYQIFNLPPSTYEVSVLEQGFESPVQTVEVKAGHTTNVNLALKATGPGVQQGAGALGSVAQQSYGGRVTAAGRLVELVDFDTLYPPGRARDIMVRSCFGCHGPTGWHGRGPMPEAAWRRAVERMFDPNGRVANMSPGVPQVSHDVVSAEEKEIVIKYFAANFGPGSTPRDLKVDPIPRDEAALGQAVYIQYELNRAPAQPTSGPPLSGSVHSVFASLQEPGVIWVSGNGSNAIVRVDTRNLDYAARTKEYWISNPANINVTPHGIVEYKGVVYWIELTGDSMGELNPKTGEIHRYPLPVKGAGGHSIWPDSRGNLWYTYFAEAQKIGRFNTVTKAFTEWDQGKGWTGYGIIVDRQDRVWAVGLSTPKTLMYNQETSQWKTYPTANPSRRPAEDANGKIWTAEYYGNKIANIDPVTDKVTEYELPLKYGNPYDVWPDRDNNIWVENGVYSSLVKFDQKTRKFTYYPFPELRAHTPKLDRDGQGTLWFTLRDPAGKAGIAALKPKGNVPAGRSVSQ